MTGLGNRRFGTAMRLVFVAFGLGLGFSLTNAAPALACTAIAEWQTREVMVGKSFDWSVGDGFVYVNPSGFEKRALTLSAAETPVTWIARHSSFTFNQYGREFPYGGLNEKGLVVEVLQLPSIYEAPDERPVLGDLQLVQFLLDTSASLSEVRRELARIRVVQLSGGIHYFICDLRACGVIEFVAGQLVFTDNLPISGITNSTYAESSAYAQDFEGFGGSQSIPLGMSSFERFVRATAQAKKLTSDAGPPDLREILQSVRLGPIHRWQITYERFSYRSQWRTTSQREVKSVDLLPLFRHCGAEALYMDMSSPLSGSVNEHLMPYSETANRELLQRVVGQRTALPAEWTTAAARYPQTLRCLYR